MVYEHPLKVFNKKFYPSHDNPEQKRMLLERARKDIKEKYPEAFNKG